jgi:hypothetical protein
MTCRAIARRTAHACQLRQCGRRCQPRLRAGNHPAPRREARAACRAHPQGACGHRQPHDRSSSLPPLLIAALAMHTWPAHADALSDAFNQGPHSAAAATPPRAARSAAATAQATVPNYTTAPPEASYFGSPGLGTLSSAHVSACARRPGRQRTLPSRAAMRWISRRPIRRGGRPTASVPTDPLLTRAKTITADPQAIAGNSPAPTAAAACRRSRARTFSRRLICHQYRTMENTHLRQGPDRHADPDPRLLAGSVPHRA